MLRSASRELLGSRSVRLLGPHSSSRLPLLEQPRCALLVGCRVIPAEGKTDGGPTVGDRTIHASGSPNCRTKHELVGAPMAAPASQAAAQASGAAAPLDYTAPPAEVPGLGPLAKRVLPPLFKLYDCTGGAKEFEIYNKDATFEDPLMKAIGVKQIKSAFYSMHMFSEAGISEYSVVENKTGDDSGTLVVDNIQHYKLLGKEFDMVSRINLKVENGLVTLHEDLWDRKPLSTQETKGAVGLAAQGCRRANMLITHLIMGFGRDLKPREAKA